MIVINYVLFLMYSDSKPASCNEGKGYDRTTLRVCI